MPRVDIISSRGMRFSYSYSVTLLLLTFLVTLRIIGSRIGFKHKPIVKKPRPNNPKIINFGIKIAGTIPPTVSRNESIAYVNGK